MNKAKLKSFCSGTGTVVYMQQVPGDLETEAKTPSPRGPGAASRSMALYTLRSCASKTPARKSWRGVEGAL